MHLGLSLLRHHGIAARYVSGYLFAAGSDRRRSRSRSTRTPGWRHCCRPGGGEPVWVGRRPDQPRARRREPRQDRPRSPLRRRAADQGRLPRAREREARRERDDDPARAKRPGVDLALLIAADDRADPPSTRTTLPAGMAIDALESRAMPHRVDATRPRRRAPRAGNGGSWRSSSAPMHQLTTGTTGSPPSSIGCEPPTARRRRSSASASARSRSPSRSVAGRSRQAAQRGWGGSRERARADRAGAVAQWHDDEITLPAGHNCWRTTTAACRRSGCAATSAFSSTPRAHLGSSRRGRATAATRTSTSRPCWTRPRGSPAGPRPTPGRCSPVHRWRPAIHSLALSGPLGFRPRLSGRARVIRLRPGP